MSDLAKLLNQKEFKDYLSTHQSRKNAIEDAIDYMAEEGFSEVEARLALQKILPALTDKCLYVFFSYKKSDEKAAEKIVDILRFISADKLQITYMAEFGEECTGKKWREQIINGISRANWFILLLPDPSEDWDWCLYETGLFERNLTKADRIICLHHPDASIPSQISDYQAVEAEKEDVSKFLRGALLNPNPIPGLESINKGAKKKIDEISQQIVNAISPPHEEQQRDRFVPWVKLHVKDVENLESRDDLDTVRVEANHRAIRLFGRLESKKTKTWGQLRELIKEPQKGDSRWREEIFQAIKKINKGQEFEAVQAVFRSPEGEIIRPSVIAIDKLVDSEEIRAFHISFLEDVGAIDTSEIPQGVSTLATLLSMAFRFRWEVLERFGKSNIREKDIPQIENTLHRIEQDAESRRMVDEYAIKTLFQDKQVNKISRIFEKWAELRDKETQQGKLDIALANKDVERIATLLEELKPINQEFLEISAKRFSQLMAHLE